MSDTVVFAFAADTHVISPQTRDWLAEDLRAIAGVDFVVIGGDLTGNGTDEEFAWYLEAIATSAVPVYSAFGGHDGNALLKAGEPDATANFRRHLGPPWYAFSRSSARFLAHVVEHAYLSPEQREAQAQWIADEMADLGPADTLIVFQHCPTPASQTVFPERNLRAVLSGHWHMFDARRHGAALLAGVTPLGQAGFMGLPRGYLEVTVGEDALTAEYVPLNSRPGPALTTRLSTPPADRPPPVTEAADWPDIHGGPAGRVRDASPGADLDVAWREELPGFCALNSPVVATGVVVVPTVNDRGAGGWVTAFAAHDGRRLWRTPLDSGAQHTPAVNAGQVLLLERDGRLSALDLHRGGRLWEQGLDAGEERLAAHGFFSAGDRIFLRTPRRVAALEASGGRLLWETPFRHEDWMGPCGCPLVVSDRVFVPAMRGDGVSAFDAATGALLWQTGTDEAGLQRVVGGLAYSPTHDCLFVPGFRVEDPGASDDGGTVGRLYALDAGRGTKLWEHSMGSYNYTTPVVADETLLVSDMINGRLLALEAGSGQDRWSVQTGAPLQGLAPRRRDGPGVSSSPAVGGNVVYLGASDGCLYALDLAGGEVLSRTDLGAAVACSPALYGRALFITTRDGFVTCLVG